MKNNAIDEWITAVKRKLFTPISKKQVTFLESDANICLGGGARGGGKSLLLAFDSMLRVRSTVNGVKRVSVDYPQYKALLIRRTYDDLMKNFKPFTDRFAEACGGNWVERRKCYEFPSGAVVYLTFLDSIKDVNKYIGGNYHYIGIEESNQFKWDWISKLLGSLRSDDKELTSYFRMTSNPGGIGNMWLKEKIVDKCPVVEGKKKHIKRYDLRYTEKLPGQVFLDHHGRTWQYVPFGVLDNPILLHTDPQYIRYLMSLEEPLRSMWLFGDWDAQVGQFFEWNELYHVIPERDFKLDLNRHKVYRVMDYGTSAPFACLFLAVDEFKNVFVFDEVVEAGLSVTPQTTKIKEAMARNQLLESDIYLSIADPAYWIKNLEMGETPTSPAQIYFEHGIKGMIRGINDRLAGAMLMRDLMRIPDSKMPKIRFTSNCTYCIKSIPSLISDVKRPEDVDTDGEDHAYDALRYGVMYIYPNFKTEVRKEKGWREKLKDEKQSYSGGVPAWAM